MKKEYLQAVMALGVLTTIVVISTNDWSTAPPSPTPIVLIGTDGPTDADSILKKDAFAVAALPSPVEPPGAANTQATAAPMTAIAASELEQFEQGELSLGQYAQLADLLATDGSVEAIAYLAASYRAMALAGERDYVSALVKSIARLSDEASLAPLFAAMQELEFVEGPGQQALMVSALVSTDAYDQVGYEVAAYYPQHESAVLYALVTQIPIALSLLTEQAFHSGDSAAYGDFLDKHLVLFEDAPDRGVDALLHSAAQSELLRDDILLSIQESSLQGLDQTHVFALTEAIEDGDLPAADAELLARILVHSESTSADAREALEALREPAAADTLPASVVGVITRPSQADFTISLPK